MKILNLKTALISSSLAIFVGVLTLGINSAIGNVPTADPANTTGVTPNFNGVNVTGNISNPTGSVNINDSLNVTGTISNSAGSVTFNDTVDITGTISNSLGDVRINDNLDVYGTGYLYNSTGDLVINDTLNARQPILNSGSANGGAVYFNDTVNVNGPMTVRNAISNPGSVFGGNVSIGDTLAITGALTVTGDISNTAAGGIITVNDPLNVVGKVTSTVGFGTTQTYNSAVTAIPINTRVTISQACPAATQILSCNAMNNNVMQTISHYAVMHSSVNATTNTCDVEVYNPTASGGTINFYAQAVCLNPAI